LKIVSPVGGFYINMNNYRKSRYGNGKKYGGPRKRGSYYQSARRIKRLDPQLFIKKAETVMAKEYKAQNKFSEFDLVDQLTKNIVSRGYVEPTAIQDQAIKPMLEGRDLVGIADTGSGKTAAFLIPLINKILLNQQEKGLIVTPTRELAKQIKDELMLFTQGMSIKSVLCIGGVPIRRQIQYLSRRHSLVIGTPGRIKDLSQRRRLKLEEYTNVVLDEVDRMLDMGFIRDVKEIIMKLAKNRQSLFFSATIPEKTRELMRAFLTDPVAVSVKTGPTARNVDQDIVRIQGKNKVELLHDLLIKKEFRKVLVFGRTKWGVNKLERALVARGFKVAAIHGNKSQGQRQRALQELKSDKIQVLLATDVASRGLDIDNITHVINYDPPETYDDYVHRIGRTGRVGKRGVALTFVG